MKRVFVYFFGGALQLPADPQRGALTIKNLSGSVAYVKLAS